MNYQDIVSEVIALTKRPDREANARSAVRQATMYAHRSDNFWRDLVDGVLVPISATEGMILTDDLLPRMRSIASIYAYNTDGARGPELEAIDVDNLLDEYRQRRCNWFYGNSAGLRYNVSPLLENLRIAYYADPDINPATYTSWIANKNPDVIIRWATALEFKSIGNTDESASELQIAQALLQSLTAGDFNVKGY